MNILSLIVWLGLLIGNCQTSPAWKGIAIFKSTRADVERLLGKPTESCKAACQYETEAEGIFVRYSDERCKPGDANALDIPQDTVVSITVYLKIKPKLRDLNLDLSKFTKTKDPELMGHLIYTNTESGITYEVSEKGRVLSILSFGRAEDIRTLRCH